MTFVLFLGSSTLSGKVTQIVQKATKEFPGLIAVDAKGIKISVGCISKVIKITGNSWIFDTTNKSAAPTFVPPEDLNSALNGDVVLAQLYPPR